MSFNLTFQLLNGTVPSLFPQWLNQWCEADRCPLSSAVAAGQLEGSAHWPTCCQDCAAVEWPTPGECECVCVCV